MLLVPAAEVQHVQLGSTASVGCNLSYLYDTTWLKHHPDKPPTMIFSASLKEGRPIQGDRSSHLKMLETCRECKAVISLCEAGDQ